MALAAQMQWIVATVIVAVTAIISTLLLHWGAQFRSRADDLNSVAEALAAHYDAVEKILDEPAAPPSMKESAFVLMDAISDRAIAKSLAEAFYDGSLFKTPVDKPFISEEELDRLKKHRPDVLDTFGRMVASGLAALFLRWPETSAIYKQMAAAVAADQRKSFIVVRRLSSKPRDHEPGGPSGLIPAHC